MNTKSKIDMFMFGTLVGSAIGGAIAPYLVGELPPEMPIAVGIFMYGFMGLIGTMLTYILLFVVVVLGWLLAIVAWRVILWLLAKAARLHTRIEAKH